MILVWCSTPNPYRTWAQRRQEQSSYSMGYYHSILVVSVNLGKWFAHKNNKVQWGHQLVCNNQIQLYLGVRFSINVLCITSQRSYQEYWFAIYPPNLFPSRVCFLKYIPLSLMYSVFKGLDQAIGRCLNNILFWFMPTKRAKAPLFRISHYIIH